MRIINPGFTILTIPDTNATLTAIEQHGRVCYKSESKITGTSAEQFVRNLIHRGHESVLEHVSISVRFVCDRGVSHELVRHRIASYSQESTRYCNYSKDRFNGEITVIKPCFLKEDTEGYDIWLKGCQAAENAYFDLLDWGCSPQEARAVLPHSLKTEIDVTMNLREWRHFFKLRCAPAAHPQMRQITIPLLGVMRHMLPPIFDDIADDTAMGGAMKNEQRGRKEP